MALITFDADKCNHDGLCVQACPLGLIRQEGGGLPAEIDGAAEACVRCGHCVAVCPTAALAHAFMPADTFTPAPKPGDKPSAEQLEALLLSRRSVRGFRKAPVPREQLERLLDVARCAPTATNAQRVSWSMVCDPGRLERVKDLCVQWLGTDPRRARYVAMAGEGRDVVLRGGTVLAVAHGPEEWLWNVVDGAIALTYMELHAAALGLGACWGGLVTSASKAVPALREVLGIPEGSSAAGALMLGLPRQRHLLVPPRNPVNVSWL
jgi:nitroreductase/Pyruvate/2-oxoacid:ferredoxin oxidoreductase delta subunit